MRHGTANRRHRQRGNGGHRPSGNQHRMQVFDSNGPDVRIRGTAHQVFEKYQALSKDAASAGDRILAESYSQHAEHYQRIINSWEEDVRRRQDHNQQSSQGPASFERPNQQEAQSAEDDLSLPASILRRDSQPVSQEGTVERTGELTTA